MAKFIEKLEEQYKSRSNMESDIKGHLPRLFTEVNKRENPVVLELGVRTGNSTSAFLYGVHNAEGELWSVDIADARVPPEWGRSKRWTFLKGDSVSETILSKIPSEFDVVFIDTSHTFEQTTKELNIYVPKVKEGGVVLMHDILWESVKKPAMTYCNEHGLKLEIQPGYHGLGIINIEERVQ